MVAAGWRDRSGSCSRTMGASCRAPTVSCWPTDADWKVSECHPLRPSHVIGACEAPTGKGIQLLLMISRCYKALARIQQGLRMYRNAE